MEKIKWGILAILLFLLVFFVFFRNGEKKAKDDKIVFNNYVNFGVYYSDYEYSVFLEPGNYTLPLSLFQIIDGKAEGIHLEFEKKIDDKESIIFVFDFADTIRHFLSDKYPVFFHNIFFTNYFKQEPQTFYRGYVDAGTVEQISNFQQKKTTLKMNNMAYAVDTFWVDSNRAGAIIRFFATTDYEYKKFTGKSYSVFGKININSTEFSKRTI